MPQSYSWEITPDPAPVPVDSTSASTTAAAVSVPPTQRLGILRPFRRDQKNSFAVGSGETLLKSLLGQVLGTVAGDAENRGELAWDTDYGSRLHILKHSMNRPARDEIAKALVISVVRRYMPNVVVTRTRVVQVDAAVYLLVGFKPRTTGSDIVTPEYEVTVPMAV